MLKEIINYYALNADYVLENIMRHFLMSFYGVLLAVIVTIPLAIFIARRQRLAKYLMKIANIIQTIPALAMLSLLIMLVGLGPNTVIVAVFLYSILPILNNTYTALVNLDDNVIDVAKGMGMTKYQILFKVELPLAFPLILGGIRNALVLGIGITAVGTFIGAGGLGDIISRGLNVSNGSAIVLAGSLPSTLMAFIVDLFLSGIEKRIVKEY